MLVVGNFKDHLASCMSPFNAESRLSRHREPSWGRVSVTVAMHLVGLRLCYIVTLLDERDP